MLEDEALEDPLPREAKLFRGRFRVPSLFSRDLVQVKNTTSDRRRIRLQQRM